jgi:ankyrin repeat protein
MIRPDELKTDEPLLWSPGTGNEVWEMFTAAIDGSIDRVKQLLAKNPALARCQHSYRSPLYFAVRENRVGVAAHLLEHGADPIGLAIFDSLLQIAGDRGHAEMQRLLESTLLRLYGITSRAEPVAGAIRARDLAEVTNLLDLSPDLVHAADARGNQPIHWAALTRNPEMIDFLLARGANINAPRPDGALPIQLAGGDYYYRGWRDVPEDVATTPEDVIAHLRARGALCDICTAARMGDEARVRELLDKDPSLANSVSDYVTYYLGSGSPLRNAVSQGHTDIVKLLLERGADPNLREEGIAPRGHALYAAASGGQYELAKVLLEHGANPDAPVESSADALTRAINNSDEKLVDLLCSYGAARSVEIMAYYNDVRTAAAVFAADPALANDPEALANAARNGHDSFVRLMLRYQPDLPERIGVAAKTPELTELLFANGMNPSHPNWMHGTPLHEFARTNDVANATIFIDRSADLHARDEDICSTPLGWAAKFGKAAMAELLLARGAKPNLPDDPPWATPLAWATRRGHSEIVKLLKRHGAT